MDMIWKLHKVVWKEYKINFALSCIIFLMVDSIYVHVLMKYQNSFDGLWMWLGGTKENLIGLAMIILKLIHISTIFIFTGKVMEKLDGEFVYFLISRTGNYQQYVKCFVSLILGYALLLSMLSNLSHGIISNMLRSNFGLLFEYTMMEMLGMIGVMLLYLSFEYGIQFDYSLLVILGFYTLNTVVPIDIPILVSTSVFYKIKTYEWLWLGSILAMNILCIMLFQYSRKWRN